jgi:hypothetical protein
VHIIASHEGYFTAGALSLISKSFETPNEITLTTGGNMNKINLEIRITNRYAPGWDSEDEWQDIEWQDIGTVKILGRRNFSVDYHGDSAYWTERAIVPRETIKRYGVKAIEKAFSNTLSSSRCRHEHDCCGCVSYHSYAEYKGGKEFLVRGSSSRNI